MYRETPEWTSTGLLLTNATNASVRQSDNISQLYYFDQSTSTPSLRYWDATKTGEVTVYEPEDLDSDDEIRTVSYVDQDVSYSISPDDYRILHQEFFQLDNQPPMMLITFTSAVEVHTTLGILTNP